LLCHAVGGKDKALGTLCQGSLYQHYSPHRWCGSAPEKRDFLRGLIGEALRSTVGTIDAVYQGKAFAGRDDSNSANDRDSTDKAVGLAASSLTERRFFGGSALQAGPTATAALSRLEHTSNLKMGFIFPPYGYQSKITFHATNVIDLISCCDYLAYTKPASASMAKRREIFTSYPMYDTERLHLKGESHFSQWNKKRRHGMLQAFPMFSVGDVSAHYRQQFCPALQ